MFRQWIVTLPGSSSIVVGRSGTEIPSSSLKLSGDHDHGPARVFRSRLC